MDLKAILEKVPLAPLGPGSPEEAMRAALADASLFAGLDRDAANACRAGLWLAFGFLDESHAVSQELPTREGSYWHALMHRREPDAGNAKYWFRKVGAHPVYAMLSGEAAKLGWRAWDAAAFVDECEAHRGTGGEREMLLREAQLGEWGTLFGWCSGLELW
jgi:hypothetical protein